MDGNYTGKDNAKTFAGVLVTAVCLAFTAQIQAFWTDGGEGDSALQQLGISAEGGASEKMHAAFPVNAALPQPEPAAVNAPETGSERIAPHTAANIETAADAGRKDLLDRMCSRILSDRPGGRSQREAERIVREMFRHTPVTILENLVKNNFTIIIMMKGRKVTDYPQFADLKGKKFPGHGLLGTPRSAGSIEAMISRKDATAIVAEKDIEGTKYLLGIHGPDGPKRFFLVHEIGHLVESWGLPDGAATPGPFPAQSDIQAAHLDLLINKKHFADAPSFSGVEYFAQATTIWFGLHDPRMRVVPVAGLIMKERKDAGWLLRNDKPLYDILLAVYGPPRQIEPE